MTSADQDYRSQRRRGPAHARTSPRWPDAAGPYAGQGMVAPDPGGGGDPRFGHQDPRWPDPGPAAYQADYYQAEYYQPEQYQYQPQPEYRQPQPEYPGWAAQPAPQDDYAGWTGPDAPRDDFSGWTGQPGYQGDYPDPGWAAQAAPPDEYPGWTGQPAAQPEYPGWAGQNQVAYPAEAGLYGQYDLHPDHPSWPQAQFAPWPGQPPAAGYGPPGMTIAPPLPERMPPPYTAAPDFPPHADAPHVLAPRRDMPLHRDMNLGDMNLGDMNLGDMNFPDRNLRDTDFRGTDFHAAPVMQDTITDVANWAQPDVGYGQPAREQIWDAGTSQLADWIIEDANQQAAEITRQARDQASTSLAHAQQEAADIVRRTGEQAALTIGAAEQQAAEIRATMTKLTNELTGMAAYVTQSLAPASPGTAPPGIRLAATAPPVTAMPAAAPAATTQPGTSGFPTSAAAGLTTTGPAAKAAAPRPAAPAAARTAPKPGAKSSSKNRQRTAVRVMTIFTTAMVLFALTAGASEVALHGFKFFVFRSTGTGETGPNGGQEDQGPGQPDAPGAHHQALQKP
jgi:hypothetical protein